MIFNSVCDEDDYVDANYFFYYGKRNNFVYRKHQNASLYSYIVYYVLYYIILYYIILFYIL